MAEHVKIDKNHIVIIGQTFIRKGEDMVELITPGGGLPPECIVLFVDKAYWDKVRKVPGRS